MRSEGAEGAVNRRLQGPDFEKIRKETLQRIKAVDTSGEDLDALLAKVGTDAGRQEPRGVRGAVARGLRGFAAGVQATPPGAFADTGLAGVVGGLAGTGRLAERRRAERVRAATEDPRAKLRQSILETQAKERVKEPFRQAKTLREVEKGIGTRRAITAGRIAALDRVNQLKPPGVSEGAWRIAQQRAQEAISSQFPSGIEPGFAQALLQQTRRELVNLQESGVTGARGARPAPAPQSREEIRRSLGLSP